MCAACIDDDTVNQGFALRLLLALTVLAAVSFLVSLGSGSIDLAYSTVFQHLFSSEPGFEQQIIQELRLPRSLAAFVTGALLALAGVIMQVLLRNPLADPYILGISGGAAVAALAVILLGLGGAWIANAAFIGAMSSILIVFGLSHGFGFGFGTGTGVESGQWSTTRLLLTGVVLSAGWGALINILLTTSSNDNIHSMLFWLMGDLSQSSAGILEFLILAAGLLLSLYFARALNALAQGELLASALGIQVNRLKLLLYFSASLLTATAVTIAGSVGFVGLIIPHMLRLAGARDHRILLPSAALLGGSFLLLADSAARTVIAPRQLPVGVLTALIGVPVFLFILRRSQRINTSPGDRN
ncbi:MAG: iron ABC transporter permease [Pseudomonadales bacterium]|nr:iron ABC transporter permease [Pseudomonadales bacterium]